MAIAILVCYRWAVPPRLQVVAFEIEQWAGQKGPIRLELADRCTVLVGRNGAGKSLMIEGILAGANTAAVKASASSPSRFLCQAVDANQQPVNYECTVRLESTEGGEAPHAEITECCWGADRARPYWTTGSGKAVLFDGSEIALPKAVGLLGVEAKLPADVSPIASSLKTLFQFAGRVRAGVPGDGRRRSAWRMRSGEGLGWMPSSSRLDDLCNDLLWACEKHPALIAELQALVKRVGVAEDLSVAILRPKEMLEKFGHDYPIKEDVGIINADEVAIGLLSDGTLRALELLWALVFWVPGSILMIEEPETGFHPGLLSRLLAEIEAYSIDRQLILSTHSPAVVSRFKPSELRLVSTMTLRTTARPLTEAQAGRVTAYLSDEGTLGEFVFGGGIDE